MAIGEEKRPLAGVQSGTFVATGTGSISGGTEYNAVGQALSRFGKRLEQEPEVREVVMRIQNDL